MTDASRPNGPTHTGHDAPWLGALHPHFTPDINLGHLVQAVVVLTTVGGGILAGYLSLRADLELERAQLADHAARLGIAERMLDQARREDREFHAEMRGALERVTQAVGDLRTALVQKQDRK